MAVPPADGSKGDEENAALPPALPRTRRPIARRILGPNYALPHSNSPTKYRRRNDDDGGGGSPSPRRKRRTTAAAAAKDDDRRVQWEEGTFDPPSSSLVGDLDDALAEMIDGTERLPPKSEGATKDDYVPVGQRSGLYRRSSSASSSRKGGGGGVVEDDGEPHSKHAAGAGRRIALVRDRSSLRSKFAISQRRGVVVVPLSALALAMLGLSLLGYVEVGRMLLAQSGGGGSAPRSDWIMGLPRSFSESILGGGGTAKDYYGTEAPFAPPDPSKIASIDMEELRRVRRLSTERAARRRARTRPPSAHPTLPAAGAAPFVDREAPSGPNLPRLTLDLPAHRELNDYAPEDDPSLQADDDGDRGGGRRRLLRKEAVPARPKDKEGGGPCGPHAAEARERDPGRFPPEAYVGPKSRVVVTGALTQLGMELILQLHEVCGVRFVAAVDAAYPNTRHERMEAVESRYKYLQRRVPVFKKVSMPVFGLHPHPGLGNEVQLESEGKAYDLVERLRPTHVVHLAGMEEGRGEHTDYGDAGGGTGGGSPLATNEDGVLMRRFDALLSMEQILSSLARFNEESSADGGPQPRFVYVSSHEADDRSGVRTRWSDDAPVPPRAASTYGTSSLLKEALASYYHRRRGVESVGLRIPALFGPFARSGSFLHDLAGRTVRGAVGGDADGQGVVPGRILDRGQHDLSRLWSLREGAASGATEQMLYVYDAAAAVISAMQFKRAASDEDGPTIAKIGSQLTVSMNDMKERMEGYLPPAGRADVPPTSFPGEALETNAVRNSPGISIYDTKRNRNLLGWSSVTGLHEGTKSMLAWEILKEYPFGLPESMPQHSTFLTLLQDTRPSLSYHTLPCAAGCRWGGGMCSTSNWDDVMETTREITKTCPYVLYTVDLRPELAKMKKQPAPSQRKGWEDSFCKIAFVSSSSKLAASVYRDQLKNKAPMNEWNGTGKAWHWIVVALKGTYDSMPEYERSLAKLSPTELFADSVSKAMYINHQRVVLSTDQAMGVMKHMEMKERTETKKHIIVDEKTGEERKISLPPHPHRHSVLFTNKYSFSDGYDTESAENLARFVMKNAGIAETKDIRTQTTVYSGVGHMVKSNMGRSPNYAQFLEENYFRYDFLRSNWLVHELRSGEGRRLRCEMYEEHALWGNAHMEDMSMGYVLARRRVKAQLGTVAETQYEGPEEWYPLLVPREPADEDATTEGLIPGSRYRTTTSVYLDYMEDAQKASTDTEGHEYYVTFLPQKGKE